MLETGRVLHQVNHDVFVSVADLGPFCKGFSGGPSDLPGLVEGFHVLLVVAVLVGAGQEKGNFPGDLLLA